MIDVYDYITDRDYDWEEFDYTGGFWDDNGMKFMGRFEMIHSDEELDENRPILWMSEELIRGRA